MRRVADRETVQTLGKAGPDRTLSNPFSGPEVSSAGWTMTGGTARKPAGTSLTISATSASESRWAEGVVSFVRKRFSLLAWLTKFSSAALSTCGSRRKAVKKKRTGQGRRLWVWSVKPFEETTKTRVERGADGERACSERRTAVNVCLVTSGLSSLNVNGGT